MLVGSGCAYSSTPAGLLTPQPSTTKSHSDVRTKTRLKQTETAARVPCTPWLCQGPLTGGRAGKLCEGKQAFVVPGPGWLLCLPLPQDRGPTPEHTNGTAGGPCSYKRLKAPTPTRGEALLSSLPHLQAITSGHATSPLT